MEKVRIGDVEAFELLMEAGIATLPTPGKIVSLGVYAVGKDNNGFYVMDV